MILGYFRYVPHHLVNAYRLMGWEDGGIMRGHHGYYCHSMWRAA